MITSLLRQTTSQRRFDVIMMLLLRHVPAANEFCAHHTHPSISVLDTVYASYNIYRVSLCFVSFDHIAYPITLYRWIFISLLQWQISHPERNGKMNSQRTRDVITTSLLRKKDVGTSFWRNNDAIMIAWFFMYCNVWWCNFVRWCNSVVFKRCSIDDVPLGKDKMNKVFIASWYKINTKQQHKDLQHCKASTLLSWNETYCSL